MRMVRGAILVALQGRRRALQLIPHRSYPGTSRNTVANLVLLATFSSPSPLPAPLPATHARNRHEAPQHPPPRLPRRARPGHAEPQALRQTPTAAAEEVRGGAVLLPQHVGVGRAVDEEPARPPWRPPHLCGSEARGRADVQPDPAQAR